MQLYINDHEMGSIAPGVATVGEMVEALRSQVDPREVVIAVEIDGEVFSAADEKHWSRRTAAAVERLGLASRTPATLGPMLREEARAALHIIAVKLERVLADLARGDGRGANRLLADLLEELRLALVLDGQAAQLDGARRLAAPEDLADPANALLEAQRRRDPAELHRLLENQLAPLLRAWAEAGATAAPS